MALLTDFSVLLDPAAAWPSAILIGSLKGTLALCAAALFSVVLRHKSASVRHLLWLTGLCGLLFMPLLSSSMGIWEVTISSPIVSTSAPRAGETADDFDAGAAQRTAGGVGTVAGPAAGVSPSSPLAERGGISAAGASSWSALSSPKGMKWLLLLWLAGALLVLARLLVGVVGLTWRARAAKRLTGEYWDGLTRELSAQVGLRRRVTLLQSGTGLMPMTWGVVSPVVLLPQNAGEWPEERLRMVLLHELTHVKRRDILTQMLAQLACALHWFNPLAWFAARQLRKEQEWACDERVLGMGFDAPAYATHLLDIARSLHRSGRLAAAGMGMAIAERSHLEGRLRAILELNAQRRRATRLILASVVACMSFVVLTLAVISPSVRAENSPALSPSFGAESVVDLRAVTPAAARPEIASVGGAAQEESAAGEVAREKEAVESGAVLEPGEPEAGADASTSVEGGLTQNGTVAAGRETTAPQAEQPAQVPATQEADARKDSDGGGDYSDEERQVLYLNGVSPSYLRELREVGYADLTVEQLVAMRTNAVSADYIRGLKSVGYNNLLTKDLIALRTNGINAEVIKSYQAVKYADFKARTFISFKTNGVSPSFLASMRAAGYDRLTPKQIVDLKNDGVTGEFINRMRDRGHANLSPEQLIELRKSESN